MCDFHYVGKKKRIGNRCHAKVNHFSLNSSDNDLHYDTFRSHNNQPLMWEFSNDECDSVFVVMSQSIKAMIFECKKTNINNY